MISLNTILAAAANIVRVTASGWNVKRGRETVGVDVDDLLSGAARSQIEKAAAEVDTPKVDGVKAVKNGVTVRP